ncbi:unnamed protein product [Brugia pahangi]|uniref:USP domain-containing protein n=1 Tax=Brugia pahangi TaxID=6280 RepID=A0A0N4T5H5_BRUPA|nr:unnamed protein product [Brugia pahangi]
MKNEFLFLPLGGPVPLPRQVDLGISFADETMPSIELLIADVSFIAQGKEDLLGIIITHAHETITMQCLNCGKSYNPVSLPKQVDLGISFADETMPGIELLIADVSFIAQGKEDLLGIIITHAHETITMQCLNCGKSYNVRYIQQSSRRYAISKKGGYKRQYKFKSFQQPCNKM